MQNQFIIDVISDVICPWCFLGKRRLDRALERLADLDVFVRWRPYALDPTIPPEGMDAARTFYSEVLQLTETPVPREVAGLDLLWYQLGDTELHLRSTQGLRAGDLLFIDGPATDRPPRASSDPIDAGFAWSATGENTATISARIPHRRLGAAPAGRPGSRLDIDLPVIY